MLKLCYNFLAVLFAFAVFGDMQARAALNAPTPIVVELFTSEGCSDCPPADAFLKTLDSTQPVPGAQLIVLEEHVDYWDDLGWRDPFSSHAFTSRQENYVRRMGLSSAYTPQMIVDGAYQFVGSDRRSAAKAFESTSSTSKVGIRISSVATEGGNLRLHVETDSAPSRADVVIAVASEQADSQVQRGENGGRHLAHVAIVRNFAAVGKVEQGGAFSKEINLSAKSFSLPGRVIVFLQEPNQGKILGAALERVPQEAAPARK
jgi:hypothetical protein